MSCKKTKEIHLRVPARLHMTVWDMNSFGLGVCGGGGIGAAIEIYTDIIIRQSQEESYVGISKRVIEQLIKKLKKYFRIKCNMSIEVKGGYGSHIGLGSTGSLVLGIIYGIAQFAKVKLEKKNLLEIYKNNIQEEHDNEMTECFETLVGPWAILEGGIVVINKESDIIHKYLLSKKYRVLVVLPKEGCLINTLEEEIKLLDGEGKKMDMYDKRRKNMLFKKLTDSRNDDKEVLEIINELKELGSKKAEIKFQQDKNARYHLLEEIGKTQKILCTGMSSIGPAYFYIDIQEKLHKVVKYIENLNEYNFVTTGIHNKSIQEITILER